MPGRQPDRFRLRSRDPSDSCGLSPDMDTAKPFPEHGIRWLAELQQMPTIAGHSSSSFKAWMRPARIPRSNTSCPASIRKGMRCIPLRLQAMRNSATAFCGTRGFDCQRAGASAFQSLLLRRSSNQACPSRIACARAAANHQQARLETSIRRYLRVRAPSHAQRCCCAQVSSAHIKRGTTSTTSGAI